MARAFELNDDNLVLIVGSGAGGGTLGNELAQRGIRTVILEAGPRIEREKHVDDERRAFEQFTWLDKRASSGSWSVTENWPSFPAFICKVVGGTTVHWSAVALRLQAHEFLTKDVYGNIAGAKLLNWPLTLPELEPYYDKAERKMGVSGTQGIPYHEASNNQMVMAAGAKKIGYKECSTGNVAINPRPRDGRPGTVHDGFCVQGIRSNAKWSTLNVEIPNGEATGNLEVRPESHVLKIEHDKYGKVTGVVYADKAGNIRRQRARIVCLAGNSIETPRILLNSSSSQFPEGLANSSGQVGKNYMRHTSGTVWGIFERPVRMYRGIAMGGCIKDEKYHRPDRGFAGGYYIQTNGCGLLSFASSVGTSADVNPWGPDFTSAIVAIVEYTGLGLIVRRLEHWHQNSISSFKIIVPGKQRILARSSLGRQNRILLCSGGNLRAKSQQEVVYRRLREFELVGLFEADLGPIGLMYDQFKGENSTSGTMGFLLDCPTLEGSTATDA